MSATVCTTCAEQLKPGARFCPKCGHAVDVSAGAVGVPVAPPAADDGRSRVARREAILGWIFLAVAGAMMFPAIFGRGGGRAWMTFGLAMPVLVIAIGCLVGESTKNAA